MIKAMSFWRFSIIFTAIAILISELLIVVQSLWLYGEIRFILLQIGWWTASIAALSITLITASVLEWLKQTETHLQIQNLRYNTLLNNVNAIAWERDLKHQHFAYISPNAKKILGYSVTEWCDMGAWAAMLVPEDLPRVQAYSAIEIAAGRDHRLEYRMRKKNGDVIWVLDIITVIKDANHQPVSLTGLLLDNSQQHRLREQVEHSQNAYQEAQKIAKVGYWQLDLNTKTPAWSEEIFNLLGLEKSEAITAKSLSTVVHPNDWLRVKKALNAAIEQYIPYEIEYRVLRTNGEERWIYCKAKPELGAGKLKGIAQDITKRKQAEHELELAASVFTHANEGIIITDPDGNILKVNAAFCRITGYTQDEVMGKNPRLLQSGKHPIIFYQKMWQSLTSKGQWSGEVWNQRKNGEHYAELLHINAVKNNAAEIQHYVALFSDITEQKQYQTQLEHLAHYDALTHLPNRALLSDRLQQAMALEHRRGHLLAVAYLDLDGFKAINDQYGHHIGDQLLLKLAVSFEGILRKEDTIARLGGDEFVVVLLELDNEIDCIPGIQRLLLAANKPILIEGFSLQVSASIGVSFYPQDNDVSAEQLLRQADQAMYQAKLAGKNIYQLFDAEKDRWVRGYHQRLERIRQALYDDEFVLYYQPKVNIRSGEIIGVEALIRWQHPEKGLLEPAEFIPLIVSDQLGLLIDQWIIESAVAQLHQWQQQGRALSISVNVGTLLLEQSHFIDNLTQLLKTYPDLDTRYLELEVLETSALKDINLVSHVIKTCQNLGISFALDDFGTGYSSLIYLKRLPATTLKIDRSFIRDMLNDPDDLAILEGILVLSSAFRQKVIAEGVETQAHCELLLRLGCDLVQGYFIARPMPPELIPQWAATWKPQSHWRHIKPVHRDDFSLLSASIECRAWRDSLQHYLKDHDQSSPPASLQKCPFGQWLHGEGKQRYRHFSAYMSLLPLHNNIHKQGLRLCQLKRQGRQAQWQRRWSVFQHAQQLLQQQLHCLLKQLD